ncbi:MAG: flagellar hook-associated protein FlgK [Pseudomonadota bacterium]
MSDMLSIGLSGVRAYQTALTTTSENIANAGTAGYARRTASVHEVVATSSMSSGSTSGLGVTVSGVARQADDYRSSEVRNASSDLARTETGATWLERIETALSGNKLADRLTTFFNSSKSVAADPASLAPRAAMLEAASSVASAFAATGNALDGAAAALDASAEGAVTQLNSVTAALAKVNSGLGRAQPGTSGQAALLDERDRLLETMSAITDVSVTLDVAGRATVRAGGSNGPTLVQGDQAGFVTYVRNEGAVSLAVHRAGQTSAVTPNAGALAGIVEGAQRIADAKENIEAKAKAFAEGVNEVQGSGDDLNGDSGEPMFAIGDPSTKLTLVLTDPRGIAAAASGGGTRNNGNLAGLDSLRTTGKFEEGINGLTTANAAALSARRGVAQAQSAMRDAAVSARDAVSGVNVDEEAVDLLRFQQAYQASSRVIQIARETLNSILEIR